MEGLFRTESEVASNKQQSLCDVVLSSTQFLSFSHQCSPAASSTSTIIDSSTVSHPFCLSPSNNAKAYDNDNNNNNNTSIVQPTASWQLLPTKYPPFSVHIFTHRDTHGERRLTAASALIVHYSPSIVDDALSRQTPDTREQKPERKTATIQL
jgi:hypothetical protein